MSFKLLRILFAFPQGLLSGTSTLHLLNPHPPCLKFVTKIPVRAELYFMVPVRLLPKYNALQYSALPVEAYRSNARFKCDILRSIFRAAPRSKRWKKKQRNAAEFLGSILHHANSFSMLWVRAAIDIKLDNTVMHYKL